MKSVFFHDRLDTFALVAMMHLKSFGHDIIVVGSSDYYKYGFNVVKVADLNCASLIDEFRSVYKHKSPNPIGFERVCFERWIYISVLQKKINEDILLLDSDVLVYSSIDDLLSNFNKIDFISVPWFNFITSSDCCDKYINYFMDVFQNPHRLEQYFIQWDGVVSDMTLLFSFGKEFPNYCQPYLPLLSGFDTNIAHVDGFQSDGFTRTIEFESGLPHCIKNDGFSFPMKLLHFQGSSKCLMLAASNIDVELHDTKIDGLSIYQKTLERLSLITGPQGDAYKNKFFHLYKRFS